jgi:hypothetical protein
VGPNLDKPIAEIENWHLPESVGGPLSVKVEICVLVSLIRSLILLILNLNVA